MAEIRDTISLEDRFTATLNNVIRRIELFSDKMDMANYKTGEFVNRSNTQATALRNASSKLTQFTSDTKIFTGAVNFSTEATGAFNGAVNRMNGSLHNAQQPLRDLQHGLGKLDKHFTDTGFKGLIFGITIGNALTRLMYDIVRLPGKILDMGDTFILTQAKMAIATNSTSEAIRANDLVYGAAQRSRSDYGEMASNVSKIGVAAKRYFSSTEEMVRFAETVSKSFTVAGATAEMRRNSTLQLIQALGSGKLQGDEFKSISEGAPLLLDALEKYTGIERGLLKEAGKEGKLTSDILKGAIVAFSKEIDDVFNKMPTTYEQALTKMTNKLTYAFNPIMAEISVQAGGLIEFLNSHLWEVFQVLSTIGVVLTITLLPSMARLAAVTMRWAYAAWAAVGAFLVAHWVFTLIAGLVVLIFLSAIRTRETFTELASNLGTGFAVAYNIVVDIIQLVQRAVNGIQSFYNVFREIQGRKAIKLTTWVTEDSHIDPVAMGKRWGENAGGLYDKGLKFKKALQDNSSWLDNIISGNTLTNNGSTVPVNVKGGKLDSVKIYEEDLVLLKDLAMREYQLNYSQVTPQMTVQFGDVHKDADVDGIVKRVNQEFIEALKGNLRGGVVIG